MEKLIVQNVVEKTTTKGDPYKVVDLMKSDGTVITGISAFKFKFPNLGSLVVGETIEGAIVIDGKYKNLVGAIEKSKGNPNFKTQQMEKVMERKENSIGKFQDNKELGIKISSTMRMATDVAISLTPDQWQKTTMQEEIRYWREWFWLEWDNYNDINPF